MATNKEPIQSAILSQCGKTLPYQRKKRIFTGGDRTHRFTKSAGRTKKTRIRSTKQRLLQTLSRGKELFFLSRLTRLGAYDEQERPRESKESYSILTASGSIRTTEKAAVYVREKLVIFYYSLIVGRCTSCALARKTVRRTWVLQRME